MPGAFNAIAATTVGCSYFTANWAISAGATGYYFDVATNSSFSSFVLNNVNVSNVVTYLVTGLLANTTYYYRVRAVNACGTTTNSNTTTATTSSCPVGCDPTQNAAAYEQITTTITASPTTWITRNLGATMQATSPTDISNAAAGCYFQFNRSQAYACDNGGVVNPAWTFPVINENSGNWTAANDPCTIQLGAPWRLPTDLEYLDFTLFCWAIPGPWSDPGGAGYAEAFGTVIKLHASGLLLDTDGTLNFRGQEGWWWDSAEDGPLGGNRFYTDISNTGIQGEPKAYGLTVRCLK